MTTQLKRLGILQAGHAPEELIDTFPNYNAMFPRLLGESSFDYRHWPVVDNSFPDSINEADAWLITGSRHGVYEDHPWIKPLEELIREIFAAGQPIVGICFGHQIIAQALGGKVEKFDGGWAVGHVDYTVDSGLFEGPNIEEINKDTDSLGLMAYHQDQVIEPPSMAKTVGSNEFCRHAVLVYGDNAFTMQPHPEFSGDFVDGLIETRGKILPPAIREHAAEGLNKPIAQSGVADTLRQFLNGQLNSDDVQKMDQG